jgi:hypothetical protein
MPTYCYKAADGEKVELVMTIQEMLSGRDKSVELNGKTYERDLQSELLPKPVQDPWRKGLESVGAAVHPDQIPETREFLRKRGIQDTQFSKDGAPVFTSRGHRKAVLRAMGLKDQSGGYGD